MDSVNKNKIGIQLCKKYTITSYEIGENTELTIAGVQRILTGETKKPREKTLDIILDYIEEKTGPIEGYSEHKTVKNTLQEPARNYGSIKVGGQHVTLDEFMIALAQNINDKKVLNHSTFKLLIDRWKLQGREALYKELLQKQEENKVS